MSSAFELLNELVDGVETKWLLEIGCGTGNTAIPLAEKYGDKGLEVWACDLS